MLIEKGKIKVQYILAMQQKNDGKSPGSEAKPGQEETKNQSTARLQRESGQDEIDEEDFHSIGRESERKSEDRSGNLAQRYLTNVGDLTDRDVSWHEEEERKGHYSGLGGAGTQAQDLWGMNQSFLPQVLPGFQLTTLSHSHIYGPYAEENTDYDLEFLCYHSCIKDFPDDPKKLRLEIISPELPQQVYSMKKVGENIISCTVKLPQTSSTSLTKTGFEYRYGLKDKMEYYCPIIKRPRRYLSCIRFFDAPEIFEGSLRTFSQEQIEGRKPMTQFISFGIDSFKGNLHGGYKSAVFLGDLAIFQYYKGDVMDFSYLFEELEKLLSLEGTPQFKKKVVIYVLKVIFLAKTLKWPVSTFTERSPHQYQYIKLITALLGRNDEQDYFERLYLESNDNEIDNEEHVALVGGLKVLIIQSPQLAISFFKYPAIVPSVSAAITLMMNESWSKNIHTLQLITQEVYKNQGSQLYSHALALAKERSLLLMRSLDDILVASQEGGEFFQESDLRPHYERLKPYTQLSQFVRDRFPLIIRNGAMEELLRKEIRRTVEKTFQQENSEKTREFLSTVIEKRGETYMSGSLIDRVSGNLQKRGSFELLIHVFIKFSDMGICILSSQLTIESILNFILSQSLIFNFVQDVSLLRETLNKHQGFYQEQNKYAFMKQIDITFENMIRKLSDKEILDNFKDQVVDVARSLDGPSFSREVGEVYLERLIMAIKKSIKNQQDCERLLKLLINSESYRLKTKYFEPLLSPIALQLASDFKEPFDRVIDQAAFVLVAKIDASEQHRLQALRPLRSQVKNFVEKISRGEVPLSFMSLLRPGSPLMNLLETWLPQSIIKEKLDAMIGFSAEFEKQEEMYRACLVWINFFGEAMMNTGMKSWDFGEDYNMNLLDVASIKENIKVSQYVEGQRTEFQYFEAIKSFKWLSQLTKCETFKVIYKQEVLKSLAQLEQNANLVGAKDFKIEDFDEVSMKIIHESPQLDMLRQYPRSNLTIGDLKKFDSIQGLNILQDLERLSEVFEFDRETSKMLLSHIEIFQNQQTMRRNGEILIKLEFLVSDKSQFLEQAKLVQSFLEKKEIHQDSTLLSAFVQGSEEIQRLFLQIEKGIGPISLIEEFSRSKELYEFAVEQGQLNFNDLYERLDDNTLLTTTTISDMNSVSLFCNKLREQISSIMSPESMVDVAQTVMRVIKFENSQDGRFALQLKNCSDSIHALKFISTASLNQSENTIKIVEYVMSNGRVTLLRTKKSCELTIKYTDQEGLQLTLPNDDISRHCNRALLLLNSKNKERRRVQLGKEDEEEKKHEKDVNDQSMVIEQRVQDDLFKNQVLAFNEMIENLGQLAQSYDRLYYSGLFSEQITPKVYHQELKIDIENVNEQLTEEIERNEQRLQAWNKVLLRAREEHYFLTYIPNQMLFHLREYFKDPSGQSHSLGMLENMFRLIDQKFTMENLKSLGQVVDLCGQEQGESIELQIIGHVLGGLLNLESDTSFAKVAEEQKKNKILIDDLIRSDRVFKVQSEVDMVRSIVTIFRTCSIQKPLNWSVLVCTPLTVISEIENFVLRAERFPHDYVHPFVIADFQRVPLQVQLEALSFIETRGVLGTEKLLIILLNQGMKESAVLEQFQGTQIFPRMADTQEMKEFFRESNATIVVSNGTGYGKSFYIEREIKSKGRKYLRILLSGEMTAEKFIDLHLEKGQSSEAIGYHYDMHPCSQVTMLLFQALIFKCVVAGDEKILHFASNSSFHIEIADSMTSTMSQSIFSFIKEYNQPMNMNHLQVDMSLESNIQVLAHFLAQDGAIQSINSFQKTVSTDVIPKEKCIELILRRINPDQTLNFYIINAFISLAGDQLRRLYKSPYFLSDEILDDQFQGQGQDLFNQIKDLMIEQCLEVTLTGKSLQNQKDAQAHIPLEIQQMHRLEGLKWQNTQNLFIFFNDMDTMLPIFREKSNLPYCLITYYDQLQRIDQNCADDLEPFEILQPDQILERMCRILSRSLEEVIVSMLERNFDIARISFTRDNFMKFAFIYMRLRVGQTVIIMGETGIGKTAIISYLAEVLNYEFRVLNLHEGILEKDILTFVHDAQTFAQQNPQQKILLFFDEINTNVHVDGVLKEIVVDRRIKGEPLEEKILLVAACNPYQLKNQQANGEVEGVSAGLQHQKFKSKLSKLVYTVRPLPESFFMYIRDYGSLSEDEEKKIIIKIISGINQQECFIEDQVTENNLKQIAECVCFAQSYTRDNEAKWAVSLRDVARFKQLFCYFYENNFKRYISEEQPVANSFTKQERAFTLALCFCYYFRIHSKQKRNVFKDKIQQFSRQMSYQLNRQKVEQILDEEYKCFLDEMEIPQGIGRNTPLKENIFVIFTCLMNKIPLFITGKPGSSKTLAMNLVMKSMKGKSSTRELFQKLPAVLPFSYQGSLQSTSAGISRVFDRAIKCQKGIQEKKEDTIVLVTIDEIGLAEISPNNPLKVLHSLLEPPQVAVVGISNWALDASKMNRGITLSRPDPDIADLLESAQSINEHINMGNKLNKVFIERNFLRGLADGYLEYIQSQSTHFHGLRDFYSLIQQVSKTILPLDKQSIEQNQEALMRAVERNFGGQNTEEIVKRFKIIQTLGFQSFKPMSTAELIKQNIADRQSRHMMLIAMNDEEDEAISLVQEVLKEQGVDHKFFQGSDFLEDETEDAAYRLINDIILCMERGISCVLVNQSIVYQSFYDMLNQNYQVVNGQQFCKVAIGADSTRCLVHPDFRCVVIVTEQGLEDMDPPLLNRFEKQKFHRSDILKDKGYLQGQVVHLTKWVNELESIQGQGFGSHDLFPVNIELNINKLVAQIDLESGEQRQYQEVSSLDDDPERQITVFRELVNLCKAKIIQMATFHGLFRATEDKNLDSINERIDLGTVIEKRLRSSESRQNLLVYTYQTNDVKILAGEYQAALIDLDHITSKRMFEERARAGIAKGRLLFVYANALSNSIQRIKLCKSILVSIQTELQEKHQTTICFIVKLGDPRSQVEQHICSFSALWEEILVEVLNGRGQTNISTSKILQSRSVVQLLKTEMLALELARDNIASIMSKINYQMREEELSMRMNLIKNAFHQRKYCMHDLLASSMLSRLLFGYYEKQLEGLGEDGDWKIMVSRNPHLMSSRSTFHGATYEYLSRLIIKYFSFVVFLMEHDGVLSVIIRDSNEMSGKVDQVLECFDYLYRTTYHGTLPQQSKASPLEQFANTHLPQYSFDMQMVFKLFPFGRHLHTQIMSIKPFFKESQASRDINEKLWMRFEASLQAHFTHLQLTSPSTMNDYMESFPLLMQNELQVSAKTQDDSSSLIMQFLKLELGQIDRQLLITDLYIAYWRIEDCIKDISKVFALIVPDIVTRAKWSEYISQNYGDKDIAQVCVESICNLVKPAEDVLNHCMSRGVDWISRVSDAVVMLEESESLKDQVKDCKLLKHIKFLLNIGFNLIKPFNSDVLLLAKVLEVLQQFDLEEEPENLIQEVYTIFTSLNEDDIQEEQNLQFVRLVCSFLEDCVESANNEEKVHALTQKALQMLGTFFQDMESSDPRFNCCVHSLLRTLVARAIEIDDKAFFSLDKESITLNIFDELLEEMQVTTEHSLTVLLVDVLEKTLYKDRGVSQETLRQAMDILVHQKEAVEEVKADEGEGPAFKSLSVRTLVSLSHFRHAAGHLVQNYIEARENGENALAEWAYMVQEVFIEKLQEKSKSIGFIVYFAKLLKQYSLSLQQILEREEGFVPISVMPWLSQINLLDMASFKSYQAQVDGVEAQSQAIIEKSGSPDELKKHLKAELSLRNSEKELAVTQALFEIMYLNGDGSAEQRKSVIEAFNLQQRPSIQQNYFLNLIGLRVLPDQCSLGRSMLEAPKNGYLPELLTFIASCTFNSSGFLFKFLNSILTDQIKQLFVPFLPSTEMDFQYQSLLKTDEQFKRFSCKSCNSIVCVVDCGKLGHDRGEGSSTICNGCGAKVGWNTEEKLNQVDDYMINAENFEEKMDQDAKTSYVKTDQEQYGQTEVRDLAKAVKLIGSIVIHSLIAIALLFSSFTSVLKISALLKTKNGEDSYAYLTGHIQRAWSSLTKDYQLSDENLLSIIEFVVYQLNLREKDPQLLFESLLSKEGRKMFEQYFQEEIVPDYPECLSNNFTRYIQMLQRQKVQDDLMADSINEVVKIEEIGNSILRTHYFSILRNQGQVSVQAFKSFIASPQMQRSPHPQLISTVLQHMQSFDHILQILPLLQWVQYIKNRLNRIVSQTAAFDLSISEVIDQHLPEGERAKARQMAQQFVIAWNQLQKDVKEIGEACDTVKLQAGLSVDSSKFIYSCITNQQKDSLGFHVYLALRYLASKQNDFLVKLGLPCKKVGLMQVKPDQILKTGGDEVEELITRLLYESSYIDPKYGQGREIHYDTERISTKLRQLLIMGLVEIDCDEAISFEFANLIEESNPYAQYADIQTKVGRQEACSDTPALLSKIQSNEDRAALLSQIRLTMSILQQTGGDPNKLLSDYMSAFSIDKFIAQIQEFNSFKLKHVLDIFEKTEEALQQDLVEKTHPNYQQDVTAEDRKELQNVIENLEDKDRQLIRAAMGRLCIRQLSGSAVQSDLVLLFPNLFQEHNTYLFGIADDTAKKQKELLENHFSSSNLCLGQAYQAFKVVAEIDDRKNQELREKQERETAIQAANEMRIQQEEELERWEMSGGVKVQGIIRPQGKPQVSLSSMMQKASSDPSKTQAESAKKKTGFLTFGKKKQ